jgi:hypothetical protein
MKIIIKIIIILIISSYYVKLSKLAVITGYRFKANGPDMLIHNKNK